jgi:hypothetical protein
MLEVVACLVFLNLIAIARIAWLIRETFLELRNGFFAEPDFEEVTQAQRDEAHRMINEMFEIELARQRSQHWNGH